jgi:hypothetical protein
VEIGAPQRSPVAGNARDDSSGRDNTGDIRGIIRSKEKVAARRAESPRSSAIIARRVALAGPETDAR